MRSYQLAREKVFRFFENPTGVFAQVVHTFIILLIVLSAVLLVIEYRYEDIFNTYQNFFLLVDNIILAFFTVEFLLRLWAAPKRGKFFLNFYNIIDFLAIAPMYLQLSNFQALRSLRLLRAMRIFRVFRIFRYQKLFGDLFRLKDTVLEKILPVIIIFVVIKLIIFFLETKGWWLENYQLETVFAVVGFVLGIILSQKIGVAYSKFILLEDAVTRMHGVLLSLNNILKMHDKNATKVIQNWLDIFHKMLLREKPKTDFYGIDEELYQVIHQVVEKSDKYDHLISIYTDLNKDASFMLNRMDALTPPAYDHILHRVTLIYSMLMVVFLPGITGIVSTLVATYVLYGMYYVTNEMDNAMMHLEGQLINADIQDLVVLKERVK